MALGNFTPPGRNEVIVRIYSYQNKCPQGTLSRSQTDAPLSFFSLTQLLLSLESLMDQTNSPQRGEEPRTFQASEPQPLQLEFAGSGKPLATFQIHVLFRQNASWQGTLVWADQSLDAQFRSVLELIRLMDSALSTIQG